MDQRGADFDTEDLDSLPPSGQPQVQVTTAKGRRELGGKLAGLSLPKQLYVLAIWPLFEQVLNLLVGTVDLALAGRLEPERMAVAATDALGVAGFVGWLMTIIYASVGVGSTALIARAVGGRRIAMANAALGQSLLLGVATGVLAGGIIFAGAAIIGKLAGLGGEALGYSTVYLRIVTLAAPASAILLVGNACLRGAGDTRSPFAVMLVVNLVNVCASVAFVYGPEPIGGRGVAGIAYGTMTAWIVGAMVVMIALIRGNGTMQLYRKRLKPHMHTIKRLMRVGIPNLFEIVGGMWLATFLVLMMVGRLEGEGLIGAHMIAIRVESLSFQPGFALGIAAATLCGQYLGLRDPQRAREAVKLAWAAAAAMMTVMGMVFILIPEQLVRVITDAPTLVSHAVTPIRICGLVQVFFATSIVLSNALRGAGDTAMTMKMTYFAMFGVRIPIAYLLGHVAGLGLPGIWIGLCSDLVVRAALFSARFLHGGWTKLRV